MQAASLPFDTPSILPSDCDAVYPANGDLSPFTLLSAKNFLEHSWERKKA